MMAEMAEKVAGEKKSKSADTDSDDGGTNGSDSVASDTGL